MYQQAGLVFYKFRYLLAAVLTAAFLVAISALVTSIGSHTVLDARTHASVTVVDPSLSETPNVVTTSIDSLVNGTARFMLSTGTALYGACRTVTSVSARTAKSTAHGGVIVATSIGKGTLFVARGYIGAIMFSLRTARSGVMFTFHVPGKIVGSIDHAPAVSSIIQPATDKPIPVISNKTSAATLAQLNATQRQQIASWQAAQAAANRQLGGSILAGDPNHGGYPAKWDTVAQDSRLDSWGMYNRECVSYTAWKVYQTYGNMPYWGGVGNANQWVRDARNAGIPTGSTPQMHSVAISMAGYYGHAMWVEKVSGNMVYVSQYNYDLHGHYSEMWVNGSSFTYIYFK